MSFARTDGLNGYDIADSILGLRTVIALFDSQDRIAARTNFICKYLYLSFSLPSKIGEKQRSSQGELPRIMASSDHSEK